MGIAWRRLATTKSECLRIICGLERHCSANPGTPAPTDVALDQPGCALATPAHQGEESNMSTKPESLTVEFVQSGEDEHEFWAIVKAEPSVSWQRVRDELPAGYRDLELMGSSSFATDEGETHVGWILHR